MTRTTLIDDIKKDVGLPHGSGLTDREERFCHEYMRTGVIVEAYRRVYTVGTTTSKLTVYSNSHDVFIRPHVQAYIKQLQALSETYATVTKAMVLSELAKLAFLDPRNLYDETGELKPVHELDDMAAAGVAEINYETIKVLEDDPDDLVGEPQKKIMVLKRVPKKIKLVDKRGALADLGKSLGMFTDKVEHTGKDGAPLIPTELSETDIARRVAFMLQRAANKQPTPTEE